MTPQPPPISSLHHAVSDSAQNEDRITGGAPAIIETAAVPNGASSVEYTISLPLPRPEAENEVSTPRLMAAAAGAGDAGGTGGPSATPQATKRPRTSDAPADPLARSLVDDGIAAVGFKRRAAESSVLQNQPSLPLAAPASGGEVKEGSGRHKAPSSAPPAVSQVPPSKRRTSTDGFSGVIPSAAHPNSAVGCNHAAVNGGTTAVAAAAADRLRTPRPPSPFHLSGAGKVSGGALPCDALSPPIPITPFASTPFPSGAVNALLLDLPRRRGAVQQQLGTYGRLRRLSSTGSLSGGSGSGTASLDPSASHAVLATPPGEEGHAGRSPGGLNEAEAAAAVMVLEPQEMPRHLEAACREVRMLAGPPANSKLHTIVMSYLKHQHRQACMQSGAPTSTLPPIPLSKPYALPQVWNI